MKMETTEQDGTPGNETATAGTDGKDSSLSLGEEEAAGLLAESEDTPDGTAEEPGKTTEDGEEPEKPKKVEFTPEQQEILEKRIGKEVAKRKELEDRLSGLEAKLDAERSGKANPDTLPQNVLAMDAEQLDALEARVDKLLDFCEANPDGTEADANDPKSKAYTAAEIRAARATYSKLARQIPRAREMARERAQVDATIPQRFPELADRGSERSRQFAAFARAAGPQFAALPNAKVLFAHMVLGEQVELARMKTAAELAQRKKTGEVPPKLPIGKGATSVSAPAGGGKKTLNLKRLVDSGGNLETAVDMLAEFE
jgi:hypothetical protein